MDLFGTAIRRWTPGRSELHADLDETFEELTTLAGSTEAPRAASAGARRRA